MSVPDLPDDILSKFLEETKRNEKEKDKKPKKIPLPKNYVVVDPKEVAKRRRDEALARLNKLKSNPDLKKTNMGSVISSRMRNPSPSLAFTSKNTTEKPEPENHFNEEEDNIFEEEDSNEP